MIETKSAFKIHLIFIGLFILLPVLYFAPAFFQGKDIVQHDIMQFQGMAKSIYEHREKYNEEPLWATHMFSGMPAHIVSVEHKSNKFRFVNDLFTRVLKSPYAYVLTALLSAYILFIAFGIQPLLSAMGAVSFAFASFMMISIAAGHNSKVACISYMPLVLAGMVLAYRRNLWLGISLFGFGLALQIVNNHVQITYYLSAVIIAYFIAEFLIVTKDKTWKKFLIANVGLALAALLALASNASYFMLTKEYAAYSIRGKSELTIKQEDGSIKKEGLDRDYVFNYSNSFTEPLTFLIPDYFGGASSGPVGKNSATAKALRSNGIDGAQIQQFTSNVPLYFGEQPFVAGPIYLGAILCFLTLFGLLTLKGPLQWALSSISFIALLLTFGKNLPSLNYFLFDTFPLYNKFRSVTMAVVIPQLCFPIIALLGLKNFFQTNDAKTFTKPLWISLAGTGGFALLVYLFSGSVDYSTAQDAGYQLPSWLLDAIQEDRKSMRSGDAIRSFALIALAAAVLYATIIRKIKPQMAMIALLALTTFDLWFVDKRYLNANQFEKRAINNYYEPSEANKIILEDKSLSYRVFNLENPFNDAKTSYFHQSIGGYSPAKMRRYQDLIERHISQNNIQVLRMLNTKYVITGKPERPVETLPALGNAWFVQTLQPVQNPDQEIDALKQFEPEKTAIIDVNAFPIQNKTYDSTQGKITLTEFKANYLKYTSENTAPGFAVFSEIYYPEGWIAYIDGKEMPYVRVNYVLRGMEIPSGNHTIEFKLISKTYATGSLISEIASYALILGFLLSVVLVSTKVFKKENPTT